MKKQTWIRLLSVFLVSCVLLTGCTWTIAPPLPERPTSENQTDIPTEPTETELVLPNDFDPSNYPDAVAFSDIVYERPDVEDLIFRIDEVTAIISAGATATAILDAIYDMEPYYAEFSTMDSVAYIHYCLNLSDTFYKDEYDYLENQSPLVMQSMELLFEAAAESPYRAQLEEEYFGEGFLDYYLTHDIYTNDTFVALSQKESELQTQYMQLQDNQTITYQGEEVLYSDLLEEYDEDYYTLYFDIYPAYYDKYNPLMAEYYIQLVQTRQQMAQAVGYETYADFAYEYMYSRDYTPDMVSEYIAQVRNMLTPVYMYLQAFGVSYEAEDMEFDDVIKELKKSLYRMDLESAGNLSENFAFMQHFGLWDATQSAGKMSGSYMTYLSAYAEPFVYISPTGTESDFSTLAHEFGHFNDAFVNENENDVLDKAEIMSQGLEALALFYSDMDDETVERLRQSQLMDILSVFVYQSMYADFENRVYQLDADSLTVDIINETYAETVRDFGMYYDGLDWYNQQVWVDINHFFIAPYYVISYCTSADAALQVFVAEEQESGAGLAVYLQLLAGVVEKPFLELLADTGLNSPFDDNRMEELCTLFQNALSPSDY